MRHLVHELLDAAAARHPERPAVVDGARVRTYGELARDANRLAHLLIRVGLAPEDRVGIWLDKSVEAVVGIYAVLKAGGAYVPLDPNAPPPRLGRIASDCGLRFLLSGRRKAPAWRALAEAAGVVEAIVVLDSPDAPDTPDDLPVVTSAALAGCPDVPPTRRAVGADLAYVLYTSGSTGAPKGVMLSHANALAFVGWAAETFGVRAEDRLSSHAPLHFDLSVFDLFAAAYGGAAVVLVPSRTSVFPVELARFIEVNGITVWYSVPSILTALTLHGDLRAGSLPTLRAVLFAGEVFPTKHLRRLMQLLPHARFFNLYGPTETNVCTYHEVRPLPEDATAIPIGKAIDGVDAFALTDAGETAAPGEVGELCVRGASVMQGYWGDAERTAKVLRAAAYHTGDLVRRDADGDYWLLGRRDAQIKTRGYRVELGEIEVALHEHPAVSDCAVVAMPDDEVTNRIVAFVVGARAITESELVRHCADRLPRYMIPEVFAMVPELPKTSTGKVDRRSLREALHRHGAGSMP